MKDQTENFTLQADGVKGLCPAGEAFAEDKILRKKIPVLACEGPCIRGDIARLAANFVAKEEPFARACYGETMLVPHSAMTRWVKEADQVIMIDGCFFQCIGRLLNNLVAREKITQIDAMSFYDKYTELFDMEDVPEAERVETARQVAHQIMTKLNDLREQTKPVESAG